MFIPITILEGKTQKQKEFIPLTYFDLPVELIAKDGTYYLLWIRDEEAGEWWFTTKLDNPADAIDYVRGKISALDMLKSRGTTRVVFRPDTDYLTIKWHEGFGLEDAQQELNILLPTEDSYLELWNVEKNKILSILQANIQRAAGKPSSEDTHKHIINPEVYSLIAHKPIITISYAAGGTFKLTSPKKRTSYSDTFYPTKPFKEPKRVSELNKLSQRLKYGDTTVSA